MLTNSFMRWWQRVKCCSSSNITTTHCYIMMAFSLQCVARCRLFSPSPHPLFPGRRERERAYKINNAPATLFLSKQNYPPSPHNEISRPSFGRCSSFCCYFLFAASISYLGRWWAVMLSFPNLAYSLPSRAHKSAGLQWQNTNDKHDKWGFVSTFVAAMPDFLC